MANQQFTPTDLRSEEWRDIPGFEGAYQVSSIGRVRSLDRRVPYSDGRKRIDRGKILSPGKTPQGYSHVYLGQRVDRTVHSLVMLAFTGPYPDGMEINHKDGNPANNRLDNLEYVTHSQNLLHEIRVLGGKRVSRRGGESHLAKLTEEQVKAIRAEREGAKTLLRDLAEKYGVHRKTIGRIVRRASWVDTP